MNTCDFAIAGGGVMGVAVAREILKRQPKARVVIFEKESSLEQHASGRNSGVLHAGFYYSPDSLKARYTRLGNQFWREYCAENKIAINMCGKLVVPTNEVELNGLHELYRRGQKNGVTLELIDAKAANEIEPRAQVFEKAIWSPTTATMDIHVAIKVLGAEVESMGGQFIFDESVDQLKVSSSQHGVRLQTANHTLEAGHFINAAGLYADQLARQLGFSQNYRILPFKGLYIYANDQEKLRTHIYPVPDPTFPFLGVHYTVTVDNHVKMGPTAIPAFWRENYSGFSRFSAKEMVQILSDQARLFASNRFNFRTLAMKEIPKYVRSNMVKDGGRLLNDVNPQNFIKWGKPGIRAQLLDTRKMGLEMDFVVEGDQHSTHILNSVSPAWTCAVPFAHDVVSRFI